MKQFWIWSVTFILNIMKICPLESRIMSIYSFHFELRHSGEYVHPAAVGQVNLQDQ